MKRRNGEVMGRSHGVVCYRRELEMSMEEHGEGGRDWVNWLRGGEKDEQIRECGMRRGQAVSVGEAWWMRK